MGKLLHQKEHQSQSSSSLPSAGACRIFDDSRTVSYGAHESFKELLGIGRNTLPRLPGVGQGAEECEKECREMGVLTAINS